MRYDTTDHNLAMIETAKREAPTNFSDFKANHTLMQEIGKNREALLKAIANGERKLEIADHKADAMLKARGERQAEVKDALLQGRDINTKRMIMIDGRLSELSDPDDGFPCDPDELRAALADLRRELADATAQFEACHWKARDLARANHIEHFDELTVRYADLVRLQRECLESMIVQAAMAGAFFDANDPDHRRRTGQDTRNPTMVEALKYVEYTAAMIDGNWIQGLNVNPEAVLASADSDIARIVKDFEMWGALPVTPIASRQTTVEAMRERVATIERNRKIMGIGRY